ncbi:MAG: metal-dependent hydrolase [Blastocatellia bacterium]|nr:metal-dependent hydrolase [Blastocatellia bacterium]
MPTIFSHAIFATAIGSAVQFKEASFRFWLLTWLCAILPDFDVVAFVFRIEYGSMFGHRGITHSVVFAILTGSVIAWIFFRKASVARWKLAAYFAIVTVSHPLLDMFTDGGLGVALLAPFSDTRFFFPWRPIEVSPIGVDFFSDRGVAVIASEALWIWLPSLVIAAVSWMIFQRRSRRDDTNKL